MNEKEGREYKEHLDWCKARALEYLPNDPHQAFGSMTSDLMKHRLTRSHLGIELGSMLKFSGQLKSAEQVRDWIEGFN